MGLLDDLKKQAEMAKSQQVSAQSLRSEAVKTVEVRAKQVFQYVHDLLKQLAVLKPVSPLNFSIPGVTELKNLQYLDSFIDNRKKRFDELNMEVIDYINFYVKWGTANKINIDKDMPAPAQKVREGLSAYGVKFAEEELRSARGTVAGWRFVVDQAINADVKMRADHDNGRMLISARNLIRLGPDEFSVPISDINDVWLEEFAKTILGHPSAFAKYKVPSSMR